MAAPAPLSPPPPGGSLRCVLSLLCADCSRQSAGEAVGVAGAPGAGGSSGLPVPAFSGSPHRQLPVGPQGTRFLFGGSKAVCLCHAGCRGKRGQGLAGGSPGQGKQGTDNPMLWP